MSRAERILYGIDATAPPTAAMLAQELGWQFYDADDFHPPANREKMAQGIPLTDEDRTEWLASLHELIRNNLGKDSAQQQESENQAPYLCDLGR